MRSSQMRNGLTATPKDTRKKITIQAQQNDDQDMESFSSFELDQLEVESRLDERADTEAVQETIGETSEPKIPVPQQQNFVGNQPESDLNLNVDLESEKILKMAAVCPNQVVTWQYTLIIPLWVNLIKIQ